MCANAMQFVIIFSHELIRERVLPDIVFAFMAPIEILVGVSMYSQTLSSCGIESAYGYMTSKPQERIPYGTACRKSTTQINSSSMTMKRQRSCAAASFELNICRQPLVVAGTVSIVAHLLHSNRKEHRHSESGAWASPCVLTLRHADLPSGPTREDRFEGTGVTSASRLQT